MLELTGVFCNFSVSFKSQQYIKSKVEILEQENITKINNFVGETETKFKKERKKYSGVKTKLSNLKNLTQICKYFKHFLWLIPYFEIFSVKKHAKQQHISRDKLWVNYFGIVIFWRILTWLLFWVMSMCT